jgi:hypothetical protein
MAVVTGGDTEEALKHIDAVWDTCYTDTEPFDRIP